MNNCRILVTVTADYVDVKRLRTSFSSIHQIIDQTVNHNSELQLRRLDRVAHELANRNACHWVYETLAKQYNARGLEAINRRISDPFQGNLMNKMNLKSKRLNVDGLSGFSSLPRNFKYDKGNKKLLTLNLYSKYGTSTTVKPTLNQSLIKLKVKYYFLGNYL